MEISFGAIMGGIVGLGSWLNREKMRPARNHDEDRIPIPLEWLLLAIHIPLLIGVEFAKIPLVDFLYDFGLVLALIPLFAITQGRWWPYLQIFVVTLIPIAGKTFRAVAYHGESCRQIAGCFLNVIIPLGLGAAFTYWAVTRKEETKEGFTFIRRALIFNTWLYYFLNHAFFGYPVLWPWQLPWSWFEGSGRSQSAFIFTVCAVCLILGALLLRRGQSVEARSVIKSNSYQ